MPKELFGGVQTEGGRACVARYGEFKICQVTLKAPNNPSFLLLLFFFFTLNFIVK